MRNLGADADSHTMWRAVYGRYGGPEVLELIEVPVPVPKKGQVLIRMLATSVNGGELQARAGHAKFRTAMTPGWPKQLGMDVVGVVESTGPGVTNLKAGDRVWGVTLGDGSYAEYAIVDAGLLGRVPPDLDDIHAAALPVAATTALHALAGKARVAPGARVLVRGAGGVGLTAVQVAHARGAHVTALASAATVDGVRKQGADIVLDYRSATAEDPSLGEFDLIFNTVSGGLEPFRNRLAFGGKMMTITADFTHPLKAFGAIAASARFGHKRTRFIAGIPRAAQMNQVAVAYERGEIAPVIDSVVPLAEVAAAHARAEQRGILGKIILTMSRS